MTARPMIDRPDALIVGGGLAGAATAIGLAAAGRSVVLLERESGPHDKVCGEFLSREAVLYLAALGVDPASLGGQRIDRLRFASGAREIVIDLPFPAQSLSRRRLDDALLRRAAASGVEVRIGARVQALNREGDGGWRARLSDGGELRSNHAFLATGKHDLRGWARPPGRQSDLLGFKMHWRLTAQAASALASHVELALFPGGYAGLESVEDGRANLCLLVERRRYAALGGRWDGLLAAIRAGSALLDRRLDGAEPCWDRPLAVSGIPYGYVFGGYGAGGADGLWRLGDQAAVIPSFAGDGMSIALHSARLAADCFLRGDGPAAFQLQMARDVRGQVRLATFLSLMAVHPLGRALIGRVAAIAPPLLAAVAAATRVPPMALARAGISQA